MAIFKELEEYDKLFFSEDKGFHTMEKVEIPKDIVYSFGNLKGFRDSIGLKVDILDALNSLRESYEFIHAKMLEYYPNAKYISRDYSSIILCKSNLTDIDSINIRTSDIVSTHDGAMISSPLTFYIYKAHEIYINEEDNAELRRSILEEVNSLINTIVEYFDPQIVAFLLGAFFETYNKTYKNDLFVSSVFADYKFEKLYETLVIHENIAYANKYFGPTESVAYIYFTYVILGVGIKSSIEVANDILKNSGKYIDIFKLSEKIPYEYYRDNIVTSKFTDYVLHCVHHPDTRLEVSEILVRIRENITKWIKHKDLSERPVKPEYFEVIDIGLFIQRLYSSSIYILGNIDNFITDIEKEIAQEEEKLNTVSEEEKPNLEKSIKRNKDERWSYLKVKSSISFLIEECVANEKISVMVFKPEDVINLLIREPEFDNAMHDSHSAVGTLFIKRDFSPASTIPINPYYIHYGEGDLSSKEALFMADVLAIVTNPKNRSLVSLACAKNFSSLYFNINSIHQTYDMARDHIDSTLKDLSQYTSKIEEEIKDNERVSVEIKSYLHDLNEKICREVKKFDELESCVEIIDNLKELINKSVNEEKKVNNDEQSHHIYDPCNRLYMVLSENLSVIENYVYFVKCLENYAGELGLLLERIDYGTIAQGSASRCKAEGHLMKNFWPITQQYEIPIEPEGIAEDATDPYRDINPGDIYHHRYGTRYRNSKSCD